MPSYTDKSARSYVIDQVFASEDANELMDNARYLRDKFDVRHVLASGEHDDKLISRIEGVVKYTGTQGSGGQWDVEDGAGFTVANLGVDAVGRGQLTFGTAFANAAYAPFTNCCRIADDTADSSDSPTGGDVWQIIPYDRLTSGFKFQATRTPYAGTETIAAWAQASNGCKFSVACEGVV